MLYLLIPIVEILIFFLIFITGVRVYRLYPSTNIKSDESRTEITIKSEPQENHLPTEQKTKKSPNAALDDYIGDFF